MGLFSSSYETQVGTVVSRVIEDSALPESGKAGVVKSLFRTNESSIPDYVMEELVVSLGTRADRMYAYAEDHYAHGLPSGEVYSSTQGRQQVEAVIEAAEGQQVLMDYSHYGPPNALHIGWMKLVAQHAYNTTTNQLGTLSAQKGTPVFLKDMVLVVPASQVGTLSAGALAQWGRSAAAGPTPDRPIYTGGIPGIVAHRPVHTSSTATELHLLVTYVWGTSTAPSEGTFTITVGEYAPDADYFHAKYTVAGQEKYWLYRNKTGGYPTLDAVFVDGPAVAGSYFPFAYFRFNKQSTVANKTTQAYLTTKKMLKYLGLDYDTVADAINENPDIAEVEQAMLMMGVPAVSTDAVECRYLFDYFDTMFYAMDGVVSSQSPVTSSIRSLFRRAGIGGPQNTTVIKDGQFRMALGNDGIYKRMVAGSIGPVGKHTSEYTLGDAETMYVDLGTGEETPVMSQVRQHKYRKQVAPGLYEEILVANLRMTYFVYGDYTTTGDETDQILLIPIDRTISKTYSIPDREVLYARSLHFVFNSRVVTEVKWYQTGVFQAFLVIVAVVITIYSYGADGGSTIAAALGLSGTAGLIATIVVNLAIGQLLAVGFKLFVKAFGIEVASAVAILAVIYGAYNLAANGIAAAPSAQMLLQLSTGLQSAVIKSKYADLLEEQTQFNLFVEEQTQLLDTAQELLENSKILSPIVIFGEKPEDFYNRAVHFGNIGTLGITAIASYVDIALALPKLNDTLGEELNG